MSSEVRVIRIGELSVGKSTIYDRINPKLSRYKPNFPKRISIGESCVDWLSSHIDAWLESIYENQHTEITAKAPKN